MITALKNWEGSIEINGESFENINAFILSKKTVSGSVDIKLFPKNFKRAGEASSVSRNDFEPVAESKLFRIVVKAWMTKPTEPGSDFDFMQKWNNNIPMPLRTMTGTIERETKGMYKMNLRGLGEKTCTCMRCGRELTNPISKYYGIGPECMSKLGLVRAIDDVEGIKADLVDIEWNGWVVKSAITSMEEVS